MSANDTMAGGIIARMKDNGTAGKVPVTGQDASVEGLQNVLAGNQCGTVYKNTNLEAKTASDLAIALINGDDAVVARDRRRSRTPRPARTSRPSLANPVWVTADKVQTVIDDGSPARPTICVDESSKACARRTASADLVAVARGPVPTGTGPRVPFHLGRRRRRSSIIDEEIPVSVPATEQAAPTRRTSRC